MLFLSVTDEQVIKFANAVYDIHKLTKQIQLLSASARQELPKLQVEELKEKEVKLAKCLSLGKERDSHMRKRDAAIEALANLAPEYLGKRQ